MKENIAGASMKPLWCLRRWHLSLHVKCRRRPRQATFWKCQMQTSAIFWPAARNCQRQKLPASQSMGKVKYGMSNAWWACTRQVCIHSYRKACDFLRLWPMCCNQLTRSWKKTGNCWGSIGMSTSRKVFLLLAIGQSFPFSIALSYQFYSDIEFNQMSVQ